MAVEGILLVGKAGEDTQSVMGAWAWAVLGMEVVVEVERFGTESVKAASLILLDWLLNKDTSITIRNWSH